MTDKKTPDIRLKSKVLMIETNEEGKVRRFFTPKKNLPYFIEFSRLFNARLVEVLVQRVEALGLDALVKAINDNNSTQQEVSYEELSDLTPLRLPFCGATTGIPAASGKDTQIRLQSTIRSWFLNGKIVKTKDIIEEFNKEKISDASIRRYFRLVRISLEEEGYKIYKWSRGEFQLISW